VTPRIGAGPMGFNYDYLSQAITSACTHVKRKHHFSDFGAFRIRAKPRGERWAVFCEAQDIDGELEFRTLARKALNELDYTFPDAESVALKFELLVGGKCPAGASKNVTIKAEGAEMANDDSTGIAVFGDRLMDAIPKSKVIEIEGMSMADLRVAHLFLVAQMEANKQSREFEQRVMGRQMSFVENVLVEQQRTNRTLAEQTMGALRNQHEAQVRAEVLAEIGAAGLERQETAELLKSYQPVLTKMVEAVLGNQGAKSAPTMDAGKLATGVWEKIAKDLESKPESVRGLFAGLSEEAQGNLLAMMMDIVGLGEE